MLCSIRGSKGAAAGYCRCSALPCSHICIVTSPECDSCGSACSLATMQMIHMGEGSNAETEELKIKYPNNCSGLYSDLIEIISSCFVSLFQGCILHFSPEHCGSLCSLGGRVTPLKRSFICSDICSTPLDNHES